MMVGVPNLPIFIGVVAIIVALLDFIGIVALPVGVFGVSAFYPGAAFYSAFAIWFGLPALVPIYLGNLIGSALAGTFSVFTFALALGNVLGPCVPVLAFRFSACDPSLRDARSVLVFVLSAAVGQSLLSAVWTLGGMFVVGQLPEAALPTAAFGWVVGDFLVTMAIGFPLLRFGTPLIRRRLGGCAQEHSVSPQPSPPRP